MPRFSLRILADLHEQVTTQAATDLRSLNPRTLHFLAAALTTPQTDAESLTAIRLLLPHSAGNQIPPRPEDQGTLREPR
ncbi:hypothetical protein Sm713_03430 [Streptomyces sp. TS71-3]|nr:hypothetical protein Sm713_03430 [Streptomyces sp. TS71-3]